MRKENKIDISIIIVNYHVKKELFECIQSIIDSKAKNQFEIIVVDNDEEKKIKKELHTKFPSVLYIPNENKGYGEGNNIGARHARGKYLFILNPDTRLLTNVIDSLITLLDKDRKIAIAAPLLYDNNNNPYVLQGTTELTPLRALLSFSLLSSLFPQNKIRKSFWLSGWDKKVTKEVKAVPGTAFIIRKNVFTEIGGFDEKFFLYFEEVDLCKRVFQQGWTIVMHPPAKVFHAWAKSTEKSKLDTNKIFLKSRFIYFKKHFGLVSALMVEGILRLNKYKIMLIFVLALALFMTAFQIDRLMPFIGDQGWYYLAARDMLITGSIPYVGIPSSHPWLHQGAFWTYMLVPVLWLGNFNPLGGAYLTIVLHLLVICLLYFYGSRIFSERVGLIAAILYAISPLVILSARMPYHTSPIPLFTLIFFYALYQWVTGKCWYFPIIIAVLAILYNFEIATFLLTVVFLIVLIYGFWKKTKWYKGILNKQTIALSAGGFLLIMLPMLLYDIGHGFPQTLMFMAWLGYKILVLFGYPPLHPEIPTADYKTVIIFLASSYQRLIYVPSSLVAFTIALFSFGFLFSRVYKQIKLKTYNTGILLLSLTVLVCSLGIIAAKTASEAYLPILFPVILLITAIFFDNLLTKRKSTAVFVWLIIGLMAFMNVYTIIDQNYFIVAGGTYADKAAAAKKIVSEADGRAYNLLGKGAGSQFESFTMNYEYLTWWLGNGPSKTVQPLRFVLEETPSGTVITKEEKESK